MYLGIHSTGSMFLSLKSPPVSLDLKNFSHDSLLLLLLLLKIHTAIEAGFIIGSGQQQVA